MAMQYLLDTAAYAEWFRYQFHESPPIEMMAPNISFVVEIERTSKLATAENEVVHVQTVAGSIGVSLGLSFAVAKRCLKPNHKM